VKITTNFRILSASVQGRPQRFATDTTREEMSKILDQGFQSIRPRPPPPRQNTIKLVLTPFMEQTLQLREDK